MIKNILSIDFNYIMYSCINLYADDVSSKENPSVIWNSLEEKYNIDEFLYYDAEALKNIAKLIKCATDKGAKLIPVTTQDEIIKLLESDDSYSDSKFNITNVDCFHDLINAKQTAQILRNFNKYTSLNWLGYLELKDKLEQLVWVKAPNSRLYNTELNKFESITTLKQFEFPKLFDKEFDIVYFSLSPHFVPFKYKHLYDMIVELFKGDQ